jgi:hypothetical protein
MNCYRFDLFQDNSFTSSFRCSYCTGIVKNPVITPNGLTLGEKCASEIGDSNLPGQEQPSVKNTMVAKIVSQLRVSCVNKKEKGCVWQGVLDQLDSHVSNDCGFQMTACQVPECKFVAERRWVSHHFLSCPLAKYVCDLCGVSVPLRDQKSHKEVCESKVVHCPFSLNIQQLPNSKTANQCEVVKTNREINNHLNSLSGVNLHIGIVTKSMEEQFEDIRKCLEDINQRLRKVEERSEIDNYDKIRENIGEMNLKIGNLALENLTLKNSCESLNKEMKTEIQKLAEKIDSSSFCSESESCCCSECELRSLTVNSKLASAVDGRDISNLKERLEVNDKQSQALHSQTSVKSKIEERQLVKSCEDLGKISI